jgi:hypothetical protein
MSYLFVAKANTEDTSAILGIFNAYEPALACMQAEQTKERTEAEEGGFTFYLHTRYSVMRYTLNQPVTDMYEPNPNPACFYPEEDASFQSRMIAHFSKQKENTDA